MRGVVQNIGLDSFIDAEACMQQPHRSQEQQTVQERRVERERERERRRNRERKGKVLGRKGRRKRESWTGRKKGEELRVKEWRERKGKRMRSRRT